MKKTNPTARALRSAHLHSKAIRPKKGKGAFKRHHKHKGRPAASLRAF